MGMVSSITALMNPGRLVCFMELIPRSEMARLMDLVKFRGVVEALRRSMDIND